MEKYPFTSTLFNSIPRGIALADPESRLWVEVNDHLCEMLGYTRDEMLKMTWTELTYPEDLPSNLEHFNRLLAGEIDGYELEKRYVRKNGTVFWAHLTVKYLPGPDGSPATIMGAFQDITKRKSTEDTLGKSEERYRLLFEHSNDAIFIFEKDIITEVNQKACVLTGYDKNELIGMHILDLFTAEEKSKLEKNKRTSPNPKILLVDSQMKRRDGRIIDVNISASFVDPKGETRQAVVRDITESKRIEESLRKSEERYRLLFEHSNDAILIFDEQGIRAINQRACMRTGYNKEQLIGKHILDLHPKEERERLEQIRRKTPDIRTFATES